MCYRVCSREIWIALTRLSGDKDHAVLECDGFELVVHQIPKQIADTIVVTQPPIRRVWGAIRLDFPAWADRNTNLFFGHDPEGNQFGVSQRK